MSKEKPIIPEKCRDEIEAERKLRKSLKAAKKVKAGTKDGVMNPDIEKTNNLSVKYMTICIKKKAEDDLKMDGGTDSVDGERMLRKVSTVPIVPGIQMTSNSKINIEKIESDMKGESDTNGLTKSQLRAQRRKVQEAQRAAKNAHGLPLKIKQDKENNCSGIEKSSEKLQADLSTADEKSVSKPDLSVKAVEKTKKKVKFLDLSFFSHLPIIKKDPKLAVKALELYRIHQSFCKFGQDCANGLITGGNARAIGLLTCLKLYLRSCELSAEHDFSRNLLSRIELNFRLVEQYRPASVSMVNCLRVVKTKCLQLGEKDISSTELKDELIDAIDSYIDTDIKKAIDGITEFICKATISNLKEVYMTFGFSSTVFQAFKKMKMNGRVFHVAIVESALRPEGKVMMKRLARLNIPCTLVFSKDISFMMKYVKMVFLGSSALLVNSDVLARAGSSQVALMAKSYNVPVLACCETYKCTNRAQTDAFSLNERGSPCQMVDLNESSNIDGLNLVYDITPNSFLTAIVTEIGIFPAGAAKAILRLKQLDTDE